MIKTQVQLPDELYRAVKRLAAEREMSLAELMRRGLEQLLCQYPEPPAAAPWTLPEARLLGADAFFDRPDWRVLANEPDLLARETAPRYGRVRGKRSS